MNLVDYALQILEKRATDEKCNADERMAYNSALCIMLYALSDNYECLAQFDY